MKENISYELTEIERLKEDIDFSKLYDNYLDDNCSNKNCSIDREMALKIDYSTNYNVNDLKTILDYYSTYNKNIIKNKRKKNDLIDTIVDFEININNIELVSQRKRLWFYIKEIKQDKYLSKYIIFN